MPAMTRVRDRKTVIQKLDALLSNRELLKRYPAYEPLDGVVFRCGPAIHDRRAALENYQELSVSTGIPVEADVVGGTRFWCWEEVWENTWDVRCLGETGDDGSLYFPLEELEYGDRFHLNATVAVNGRHHIAIPGSYGQPLEIEQDGDEFYEVSGLVDDCRTIPRGADDRHCLRFEGGGDFAREQLPAEWFALAAAGDDETHWHDFNDGTGKITSQIGQVGNNWIIRTTIRNHILSVPRLARVTVSDSKGQWIAQGFIGLYDLKKDNRSAGQLAINVVRPPIFESADDDKVRGYYYAVEPWRIEDLKAADRETVKLSLTATDHSLSREVLEEALEQLPSDDPDWEWNGVRHPECAVIFKVREEFGGLSNMSNEFPLAVDDSERHGSIFLVADANGARPLPLEIGSVEALYQACRYPHQPDWQREIFDAPHAMPAKMAARKQGRRKQSRSDWNEVRVDVMRWCLRVKLDQHFGEFYTLLKSTGDRAIVEKSRHDRFWGTVLEEDNVLRGENMLGSLLMELRDWWVEWLGEDGDAESPERVLPAIPNFSLLGRIIEG
ncbi:MAG: NADAR family protein [Planctomycetaceae bacterium]